MVDEIVALPPVYPGEPGPPSAPERPPQWSYHWEPMLGDVYENQRGNFMVIIGAHKGGWHYLNFSAAGELMFDSQATRRYFAQRKLVGRVSLPTLTVEPINA